MPERYLWRNWAADNEGITGDKLLAFVNDDLFPTLKICPRRSISTRAAMWLSRHSAMPITT